MKSVIQRVNSASVEVNNQTIGKINKGILVLLGISKDCNEKKIDWMVNKILTLRLWKDETDKNFKKNIEQINGELLIVSQFTLFGDCSSGTKPKFNNSMPAETANQLYEKFLEKLNQKTNLKIQTGKFQAMMNVKLENDGPITLILEK